MRWKLSVPALLNSTPPMARLIIQFPAKRKQRQSIRRAKKCTKWGDKEKAIRKRQQGGIWVSTVLEPEAGRRPEICLPGAGSVEEPIVTIWPLGVWLLKNYIAPYSDQVPHYPSPLSSKSLIDQTTFFCSPPISVFPSLPLVQVRKFFHRQYLHFMIFRFFSPVPVIV